MADKIPGLDMGDPDQQVKKESHFQASDTTNDFMRPSIEYDENSDMPNAPQHAGFAHGAFDSISAMQTAPQHEGFGQDAHASSQHTVLGQDVSGSNVPNPPQHVGSGSRAYRSEVHLVQIFLVTDWFLFVKSRFLVNFLAD